MFRVTTSEGIIQNPAAICPPEIFRDLRSVSVLFLSFSGSLQSGTIEIHKELAEDIQRIFAHLIVQQFPLQSVIPVSEPRFAWSDERSMAANNTSGFNYREIAGKPGQLSQHAYGFAIDINPLLNPCIESGVVQPAGAVYQRDRPGTLHRDHPVVHYLRHLGWEWGGDWKSLQDYHHFQKIVP